MSARLLIVTPVRNEAEHLEIVARAMAAQTRQPDRWLLVDDGSTDETPELLRRLERDLSFAHALRTPPSFTVDRGDRHAVAAAPRAFNYALRHVSLAEFTHIGKLDGDIELPPGYFEELLAEFDRDPRLGLAGGTVLERDGGQWLPVSVPEHHVRGALKLYSRDCLNAIGGVRECLGWDGIDGVYARMRGYETRSFAHLLARHHRPCGTADGRLRSRRRAGELQYVMGAPLPWVLLKSLQTASARPAVISGLAFLYGYARAAAGPAGRVEDDEYLRFMRRELWGRMRRPLGLARSWPIRGRLSTSGSAGAD